MDENELEKTINSEPWKACLFLDGGFQRIYQDISYCDAGREEKSCPYWTNISQIAITNRGVEKVHFCEYLTVDEVSQQAKNEIENRIPYILRLPQVGQSDVSITISNIPLDLPFAKVIEEMKQFPFSAQVTTQYCGINNKRHGFVTIKDSVRLTRRRIQKIYQNSGLEPPRKAAIDLSSKWTPKSMTSRLPSPLITHDDAVSTLFIDNNPFSQDEIVGIPLGGKGQYSRRLMLTLPYHTLSDLLKLEFNDKIVNTSFYQHT